jgi:hypothetical protein
MKPAFSVIWNRIISLQGQPFRLARGKQVTYSILGDVLYIDDSDSRVHISQFEHALGMVPVSGPVVFNEAGLWGPSYLYAIMMDSRVSLGAW